MTTSQIIIRTSIKTFACLVIVFLGFSVLFPVFAHPASLGPPKRYIAMMRALTRQSMQLYYVDPIEAGVRAKDIATVGLGWQRFRRCSSYFEDPHLRLDLAQLYFENGKMAVARDHLAAVLKIYPNHAEALALLRKTEDASAKPAQ